MELTLLIAIAPNEDDRMDLVLGIANKWTEGTYKVQN
jgi:hypothetical protein